MNSNILFVTSAARTGGAERTLIHLVKSLDRSIFSALVLLPEDGMLFDELKKLDVKIVKSGLVRKLDLLRMTFRLGGFRCYNPVAIVINILRITRYFMLSVVMLPPILKKLDIDIICVNSIDVAARFFLIGKFIRRPVVLLLHSIMKPSVENLLLRRLIDMPSRTICCSNAARRSILKCSKEINKIETLYHGIDLGLFKGVDDASGIKELKEKLGMTGLVVGMVGRFDAGKGHETFIEAASMVAASMSDINFIVVGSWVLDFERPRIRAVKEYAEKMGPGKRMIFTGFVDDVRKYYRLMDIVVIPSWEEPLALVIMEAMALKRPVIATNSGGTPEIVEDGVSGILVRPKDPGMLAGAIIRLAKDEALRGRLAAEGRKTVERFFDGARFERDMENIYKEVLT